MANQDHSSLRSKAALASDLERTRLAYARCLELLAEEQDSNLALQSQLHATQRLAEVGWKMATSFLNQKEACAYKRRVRRKRRKGSDDQ